MNSSPTSVPRPVAASVSDEARLPLRRPPIVQRTRSGPTSAVLADPETLPRARRERRERIIIAALDLLEDREYDKIQVRDVAEHADVALGTVYRYFSSKEHLYAAVLVEWSKSFKPRESVAAASAGESASEAEQLLTLLRRAIRAFERKPQMLRAQVAIESSSDDNARALFYQFGFANHSVMSAALHGSDAARAAAIIETVNSVLSSQLRYWALGLMPIDYVHAALERTVGLIYPDDPEAQQN